MKTRRPALRRLAASVLGVLRRVASEITSRLRQSSLHSARCPSLRHWVTTLAEAAEPALRLYFGRGGNRAARQLLRLMAKGKSFAARVQKAGLLSLARRIFDALHSYAAEAVRRLALDFAESTLATIYGDVTTAIGKIKEGLLEGLQEGEGLRELTRRVRQVVADPKKARTIARTEAQRAIYAGEATAHQRSGVVVGHKWLTAPAACPICQSIDGKEVKLGEPFLIGMSKRAAYATVYHPPAHVNCLLGGTSILPRSLVSGYRAKYFGPCVRIVFASGDVIACTPQHMLLTPKGFMHAGALVQGDDVIHCPLAELAMAAPDDDWNPARIDEVVASLTEAPGMAAGRVPVAPEYFHGDAARCVGEIDVVGTDCLLRHGNSLFSQADCGQAEKDHVGKTGFQGGRLSLADFVQHGTLAEVFRAFLAATDGGVGSIREAKAFSLSRFRHANAHAFASAPWPNARRNQTGADAATNDAVGLRKCQFRFPSLITTNKVIDVDVAFHDGPVYDVETESSLYIIGSGIVSSNCRCSWTAVIDKRFLRR